MLLLALLCCAGMELCSYLKVRGCQRAWWWWHGVGAEDAEAYRSEACWKPERMGCSEGCDIEAGGTAYGEGCYECRYRIFRRRDRISFLHRKGDYLQKCGFLSNRLAMCIDFDIFLNTAELVSKAEHDANITTLIHLDMIHQLNENVPC